jgi:peptidoglycan/LPS O-acetylase OafA/YrhL
MRAVAVLLVVLGHAGVTLLPGGFVGVDVFFVISGFLITGLLVEQLDRDGRISLSEFYARRAKRLLPAATTVLVATLLLTYFFLPRGRWSTTAWDVIASACYWMNWRMAAESMDYVAANSAPSIVLHFWSLAVEEQFYLVWPLLLIVLGLLARRWGRPGSRGLYLAGLALIAVPSFAWALHTSLREPSAYYTTTTRMWELAVGGAVAIAAGWLSRTPRPVAATLAWAGLVAVCLSAVLIRSVAGFPGHAALGPTLGTAAVIAFGTAAGRAGPAILLGRQPLQYIGAISYSLYLWHWPLLVAAQARFGDLSVRTGLTIVAASAIPAVLTYHFIENPIRRSRDLARFPFKALRVGAICTGIAVLAGLAFQLIIPAATGPGPAAIFGQGPGVSAPAIPAGPPGATALGSSPRSSQAGNPVDKIKSIIPDPMSAKHDAPMLQGSCHLERTSSAPNGCAYGDPAAEINLVLVGDSHADHWVPAMRVMVEKNGWGLTVHSKSGCPFLVAELVQNDRPYETCTRWNKALRARLLGPARPDLLITTHAEYPMMNEMGDSPSDRRSARARELRRTWAEMIAQGIPVVVLRDTPLHLKDMAECVSENMNRLTRCTTPRDEAEGRGGGPVQKEALKDAPDVRLIDLNDWICPTDRCAAVIGGVLVYRDDHHLTSTYSATLAPMLTAAIKPILTDLRLTPR